MDNSVIVSLRDIVVEFDGQRILDGLNLDIHDKEFVTLLGPSGCGKTTTLRLIAGFLEPNAGQVLLKGQDITGVPPYKRPVNTVFQKYALFPHLNVFENVAFGLRLKKMDEETIRRKVRDMLEVVGLKGFERSYELGASDYVNRPFDARIVYRRVTNTIKLYAKQRRLVQMVSDQIRARENNTDMLVGVLSHIVEFRNGESGAHVRHIRTITEMLLHRLLENSNKYSISAEQQDVIPLASALHDIGKIGIDEKILNKPGKLTPEEFEVMKTHSMLGAEMLHDLDNFGEQPLLQTAYEIARWHHERWDGRGYPDGLKGDEIPISAQLVSLADVYDALTSERCYKKAFSHEKAMQMILNGECGAFNPLLLQCLTNIQSDLKVELQ